MKRHDLRVSTAAVAAVVASTLSWGSVASAQALPGGTLDPLEIPKYVTPLVIPPVMENAVDADDQPIPNDYDIAVREFQQQILPGGHWNELAPKCKASPGLCILPATTVWSYGPAKDPLPDSSGIPGGAVGVAPAPNSQFNYPAYTIEAKTYQTVTVDWINDLVVDPWSDPLTANRDYIPHLLPIDRSLHWANPEQLPCVKEATERPTGTGVNSMANWQTDCRPDPLSNDPGTLATPYTGPVPIITHVHGAHVGPESDGYPEAWYLPGANNIPSEYATQGRLVNEYGTDTNVEPGVANFTYPNTQPSTTLWYHDHTLGMTRNNVYAGPAGFWLLRSEEPGAVNGEDGLGMGNVLPSPAPVAGEDLLETNVTGRDKYREIPIVIQDRAFNTDGSLFYPANRAFFEGLGDGQTPDNLGAGLDIPFFGEGNSDIAPIWNPEAFFNVMVVNGVSWPELEVAPAIYRFRLLNGSNSRFLNLAMFRVGNNGALDREIPFYQIGAEQSLLPHVVRIETGFATPLFGDGRDVDPDTPDCLDALGNPIADCIVAQPAPFVEQAMLMGLAERADVLVDFTNLKDGTVIRMINTAPDAPFGGFPDVPADPATTGQVMQFRVNSALLGTSDTDPKIAVVDKKGRTSLKNNKNAATKPQNVVLSLPESTDPALDLEAIYTKQDLALLEEESATVCVNMNMDGTISWDDTAEPTHPADGTCFVTETGALAGSVPFAPKAAVLGTMGSDGGKVQLWADPMEQNPTLGSTETWELWNWSADAHPIHLHLVKFKVVNREAFDPATGNLLGAVPASAHEAGWKDTVIAYPGEVTRVNATFDIPGLYVWHCHIVEHEDNEMMVPYCVGNPGDNGCQMHASPAPAAL